MMQNMRQYNNKHGRNGFTLVELIIVVVILSIAALMAVPMVSSAADMQVRSAANQIAAHLDYTKSMAITHQQSHSVVFDATSSPIPWCLMYRMKSIRFRMLTEISSIIPSIPAHLWSIFRILN
jgi:prepilin-type N-terminal cleavage/methylation domain-containing protein